MGGGKLERDCESMSGPDQFAPRDEHSEPFSYTRPQAKTQPQFASSCADAGAQQGGAASIRVRLLQILMRGNDYVPHAGRGDRDSPAASACDDTASWLDDAAARAWGAFAAIAHFEGHDFCRRLSPWHAALRAHSASPPSSSWLICPASWAALTLMMRKWALDFPPTRSMLCHAAWSPALDILLPPSAAVFAAAAGTDSSDSSQYQLAAAMRQRRVFFEAYIRHRCPRCSPSLPRASEMSSATPSLQPSCSVS